MFFSFYSRLSSLLLWGTIRNIRNTKGRMSGTNIYKEHFSYNQKKQSAKTIDIAFDSRQLFDTCKQFKDQRLSRQSFLELSHPRHLRQNFLWTYSTHATQATHEPTYPWYPRHPRHPRHPRYLADSLEFQTYDFPFSKEQRVTWKQVSELFIIFVYCEFC